MKLKREKIFQTRYIFFISASIYFLIASLSGFFGWRSPDCNWYVSSAHHLFTLEPYSHHRLIYIAPPLGIGFNYPPLLLFLIGPFIFLGQNLGWSDDFIAQIYGFPLFLIDILDVYLIIKIITAYRPRISRPNLSLMVLIFFFSGYFLMASAFMGHPETLVLFFSLLGILFLRKAKLLLSGIFFGLALLAKQPAIFILIPVFFYLLFQKNGFRSAFKLGSGTAATFLLIVFPFFIANPSDAWYSLFVAHQRLVIRGSSLWWFIESFSRRVLHLEWVNQVLIRIALPLLSVLSVLLSTIFLKTKKIKIEDSSLFGLISASLLLFTLLIKWLSFHSFLWSFVFIILWDILRRKEEFPVFGVTYAFLLLAANFLDNPLWQLWTLLINLGAFTYVCYSLARLKE